MLDKQKINYRTRDIYHKQHTRILNDDVTRQRIMNIKVNEEFFKLENGYFKNKKVLDVGCGSLVRNSIAYTLLGSDDVTALELGNDWFETARENIKINNVNPDSIKFVSASVDELPFKDNTFDFVSCDSVITHLANQEQVIKTIQEACRVTKKGGNLFISFMSGGGLIETKLSDASKEHYRENDKFKDFIDNLQPKDLHDGVDFILEAMVKHKEAGIFEKSIIKSFKKLLDEDFCIGLQNTVQSDTRDTQSLEFVNNILEQNGFSKIVRLKRYISRNNIRKFVAPLHYYSENRFSQLLYGDGWIDGISKKIVKSNCLKESYNDN